MISPAAFLAFVTAALTAPLSAQTDPFRLLRAGYAAGDAAIAASAYTADAEYIEQRAGGADYAVRGTSAIRETFSSIFRELGISAKSPADLNFRSVSRTSHGDTVRVAGLYRLVTGDRLARRRLYGRFRTIAVAGRFVRDESGAATEAEFESAAGDVMLDSGDEELTSSYYDDLTGRFAAPSGCGQLVTHSVIRLFILDECTGDWRRLSRVSGRTYSAGSRVVDTAVVERVTFAPADGDVTTISRSLSPTTSFTRDRSYRIERVRFGPGERLAGTVYVPTPGAGNRAAVVLIHGSGEQDRNGYASYIALLATHLTKAGLVVLTYDKRGTGLSDGDWNSAGFRELSSDAVAGLALLRQRADVDAARVGLGGSSQAGWVAATAVRDGAAPAFAILIGAAGAALSVEEQNIYNTRVRMQCANLAPADIALGLDQQRAFFAARRSRGGASALSSISRRAAARPALRDWVFPSTVTRGAQPEWYDVLDPSFDPLPVWRAFPGRMFFLFGSLDDSTPAVVAVTRLRSVARATVETLSGAQHLGLQATSLCAAGLADAQRFHPDFFATLTKWARSL